jgi:hypothetical protein
MLDGVGRGVNGKEDRGYLLCLHMPVRHTGSTAVLDARPDIS